MRHPFRDPARRSSRCSLPAWPVGALPSETTRPAAQQRCRQRPRTPPLPPLQTARRRPASRAPALARPPPARARNRRANPGARPDRSSRSPSPSTPATSSATAASRAESNALVPAGGFEKPCNTTGTATAGGVPEATVTFDLARAVEQRLEALGAKVRMTRNANSDDQWGPCVDARGQFGKRVGAQVMVSLHADGSAAQDRGFHVIAPTRRTPWTTDIAGSLAEAGQVAPRRADRFRRTPLELHGRGHRLECPRRPRHPEPV